MNSILNNTIFFLFPIFRLRGVPPVAGFGEPYRDFRDFLKHLIFFYLFRKNIKYDKRKEANSNFGTCSLVLVVLTFSRY